MAVTSALWWSVWWPWMTVWLVTVVSMVATVSILGVRWRSRRKRSANKRRIRGVCFYLDDRSVMDLYQLHRRALSREVQEGIDSGDHSAVAKLYGLGVGSERSVTRKVVRRYVETDEPITVINTILDVLEEAEDIVDVDLRSQRITPNAAVVRAGVGQAGQRSDGRETASQQSMRLRDLETFVSVWGRFRVAARTHEVMIFLAPYGEPADPSEGPQVRVACARSGLRTAVPEGTFLARCVGRVQDWNPERRELIVQPIAIFQ